MEQTLIYTNTTKPMSRCYSNPPPLGQNQEILIKDSSKVEKGSNLCTQERFVPTWIIGNDDEDDVEDEESEFKMGRLIRQASLNSSHMSIPQQAIKVVTGSSSLQRYSSQKFETNQEKIIDMRKVESMKERNKSTHPMKIMKNINGGAPTIPGRWVDKGSSEDVKAQIKFWARAVAFNLHQEC